MIDRSKLQVDFTNGTGCITINGGEFDGIKFSYGKVEFPDEAEPIMSFHYDIHSGEPTSKTKFETAIGDLLIEMIKEQLTENTLVYSGGT